MESFTPIYLIYFLLRIQQCKTSYSRTHLNGDSHTLAVKRMCMNQALHSYWYLSVSILYQTESKVVGRALVPVAHESLIVCLILNYVNMNSTLSHFTVNSSRFLESLSSRNYLSVLLVSIILLSLPQLSTIICQTAEDLTTPPPSSTPDLEQPQQLCYKLHLAISPSILHRFSRSQWLRKALKKTFR